MWDSEQRDFLTWDRAKEKFSLVATDVEDCTILADKIPENWRTCLEDDLDTTYQGDWIVFYVDGKEDPTFGLQCDFDFAPPCMEMHHLSLPLPVQCFTVGTRSCCLREWEKPEGKMASFFHKVKIIRTNKGPKKGEKEIITFFYGKLAILGWDLDRWR